MINKMIQKTNKNKITSLLLSINFAFVVFIFWESISRIFKPIASFVFYENIWRVFDENTKLYLISSLVGIITTSVIYFFYSLYENKKDIFHFLIFSIGCVWLMWFPLQSVIVKKLFSLSGKMIALSGFFVGSISVAYVMSWFEKK